MIASIITIPDGITIRLPNGWEVSDRQLAVAAVALIAVLAAVAIWGIVRLVNRRHPKGRIKRPASTPGGPSEAN